MNNYWIGVYHPVADGTLNISLTLKFFETSLEMVDHWLKTFLTIR